MQFHPHLTSDELLGVLNEGVERLLERRRPHAVVHKVGPLLLDHALVARLLALQGDVLHLLVGLNERDRAGGFVDLAALDANKSVLNDVDAADALGTCAAVHLLDRLQRRDGLTVDRHGDTALERDDNLVRHRREGRVVGVVVDVFGGRVPDVLEESGLNSAAPHILVDREGVLLGGGDRQVVALGVVDRLVAGEREVTHGCDALEFGCERDNANLKADLVIALAGAAVGNGRGTELLGSGDEVLDDDGPRQRRNKRILVVVERVRLERGHAVLLGELVASVGDIRLDRAAIERALADHLKVLASLADIDGHGDDFGARGVGNPADSNRRVKTSRVGEDDAFGHEGSTFCSIRNRDGRRRRGRETSVRVLGHPALLAK